MFQIIFNQLSAAEMSALPKTLQLALLAEFQILPEERALRARFGEAFEQYTKSTRRWI